MARVGKAKRLKRQERFARQRTAWWAKHDAAAAQARTQPDWQRGGWTQYPGEDHQAMANRYGVSFGTMDIDTGEVTIDVEPQP
jgi:hypothetical protein